MQFLKQVSLTPKVKAIRAKIRRNEAERKKLSRDYKRIHKAESKRLAAVIKRKKKAKKKKR